MKQFYFPAAFYGLFLSYSLCVFFFDKGGFDSYKRLEAKIHSLAENMTLLEEKNAELKRLLGLLQSDPETMTIAARNLGLYKDGQLVMHLPDKRGDQVIPDAGKVVFMTPEESVNRRPFRIISIAAGLLLFITVYIVQRAGNAR